MTSPPVALTIAGSDSGGGAGIQADLRTFAALGCHGVSAITAITAQNTVTVTEILELPVGLLRAQIEAIVADLRPAAAKTGMLSSPEIIEAVARAVDERAIQPLVVDPVMVAKGGARLLQESAITALRSRLLPLATVLTPNLPEAEVLLGRSIHSLDQRRQAAAELGRMGPRAVVVKGGHAEDAIDVLYLDGTITLLEGRRVSTRDSHGSGCTFSAAICAGLARGLGIAEAVAQAKEFIQGAIEHGLRLGAGHGPVNSMWRLQPPGRS